MKDARKERTRPPPRATAFERAIAARATAYARAWLRKHGLAGKVLDDAAAALEPKLVEVVANQCADLVVLALSDDGLAIVASDRDEDLTAFLAATDREVRGHFGLNLPIVAREVRRAAEGCGHAC
jgi:hypothetical protein